MPPDAFFRHQRKLTTAWSRVHDAGLDLIKQEWDEGDLVNNANFYFQGHEGLDSAGLTQEFSHEWTTYAAEIASAHMDLLRLEREQTYALSLYFVWEEETPILPSSHVKSDRQQQAHHIRQARKIIRSLAREGVDRFDLKEKLKRVLAEDPALPYKNKKSRFDALRAYGNYTQRRINALHRYVKGFTGLEESDITVTVMHYKREGEHRKLDKSQRHKVKREMQATGLRAVRNMRGCHKHLQQVNRLVLSYAAVVAELQRTASAPQEGQFSALKI